jgi:hypothetical protein
VNKDQPATQFHCKPEKDHPDLPLTKEELTPKSYEEIRCAMYLIELSNDKEPEVEAYGVK